MKKNTEQKSRKWSYAAILMGIASILFFTAGAAYADMTVGSVAAQVTKSMSDLAKLITAASYVAGFGFAVGAILKFKAHKDNPTQIPVGTPIALIFIAAALIFLPTIFGVTGSTLFAGKSTQGTVSGVASFK